MESPIHALPDLFRQLGLADEPAAVAAFIAAHQPLPVGVALADAAFWSASQARLLRDEIAKDADWAEVIDSLAVALSG